MVHSKRNEDVDYLRDHMMAADAEIVSRFETLEMGVDDIAIDLGLEEDAVRMCLTQNSGAYRNTLRVGKGEERKYFDDLIAKRASQAMEILLDSQEDAVKYRAAKFIMDEHSGRNDASVKSLRDVQSLGIGVLQLNAALLKARQQISRVREIGMKEITI